MKIFFSGAAQEVTGSKHLLEINGKKILLDCGLFQGRRKEAFEKNQKLPFDPATIDAVILSHAHLDHCGNLPTLTKNGFKGTIYTTQETADIVPIMLNDSAYIQEMDSRYAAKRFNAPIIPVEPLYRQEDIPAVIYALKGIPFHERFEVFPNIDVEFFHAGHILGAAIVKVYFTEEGNAKEQSIIFTGDLGRPIKNLLPTPEAPATADYLITESTYGNRLHEESYESRKKLEHCIVRTVEKGGKIIIPSFSLQRTQELIYDLHLLQNEGKIPFIPIYIDSPLAIKVTAIYKKYRHHFDQETYKDFFSKGQVPLESKNIFYTPAVEDSKKIKNIKDPCIIVAASGMCEGGRIRHHLKNEIEKSENTILFVGYQASYTLGRKILEHQASIRIFNEHYRVNAHIEKINGYSGHADQGEIMGFIRQIKDLKKIFVVHGEIEQSGELKKLLLAEPGRDWEIEIPASGDLIEV